MITYNFIPADNYLDALKNLYEIIGLLRSPDGCPWDKIQTPKETAQNIIDETYEYLEAVLNNDVSNKREEIGDVLVNVLMGLQIHRDYHEFNDYEAINEICEKLIRRHPHVFSNSTANSVEEVLELWNQVKEKVEGHTLKQQDFFEHIPKHLPMLAESFEIQKTLKKKGLEPSYPDNGLNNIAAKLEYLNLASTDIDTKDKESAIGALLYSIVDYARRNHLSAETCLHHFNSQEKEKFQMAFDIAYTKNIPIDKDHVSEILELMGDKDA